MSQPSATSGNRDLSRPGGTLTIGGDLEVARLGFGAMRITGQGIWGEPDTPEEAHKVLRRAVDLGITLIDTADSYGPDVSERLIGEVLYPYPEGLVIATKGGLVRPGPGRWERDGRPEHLRQACDGSLKRLKLDRIDLYQLHAPDPDVALEESLGALADLQAEGKIRHIGVSNVSVEQLRRARRSVAIVSVQNHYNIADREHDPVLQECERAGMAFLPYRPLARSELGSNGGAVARVAARHDATPGQVALAWLLARSPVVVPIPGTSSVAHLEQNVAAARLALSAEDLDELA